MRVLPLAVVVFLAVLSTVYGGAWGGCPDIISPKRRIKAATNKRFDFNFKLKNDGVLSYSNYFVAVTIPEGAQYVGSAVKIAKTNAPQITPTVTDAVVVWRFPRLPSRARVKFTTILKVDPYCVPDGMLALDISGYQIVNTTVECSTTVSQGVRSGP